MKKIMMTVAALGGIAFFAGNALAASDSYCRNYANNEVNKHANPVGSAALGCIGGGVLGSLLSNGQAGSIAGGCVVGGATTLVLTQAQRDQIFNQAYYSCRGSYPQPQPIYDSGAPPAGYGQDWWMQSCAAKYKSFQWTGPYAGQFKGFDGLWHWCSL